MEGAIELDKVIKKKEELSAEINKVSNNLLALRGAVAILDLMLKEHGEGLLEEDPSKIE